MDPYDGVASFLISENLALTGSPSINFQTNAQSAEDLGFDLSNYLEMRSKLLYHEKFVSESLESENYTLKNYFTDQRIEERFLEKNENFFGPSYLPLPIIGSGFYHLAEVFSIEPIHFVPLMLNSIILSLSCVVLFYITKEMFGSEKIGFLSALFFGLTSFIWPYITSMYSRPLAILFFLVFIYLIFLCRRNNNKIVIPLLAGFLIPITVISHYYFMFFLPVAILYGILELHKNKKHLSFFIFGSVAGLFLLFAINYLRFEDILVFGIGGDSAAAGLWIEYHDKWYRTAEGLYGYLFSPGKNIFIYFPLTLVLPFGLYYLFKREKYFTLFSLFIISFTYIYLGTNPEWHLNISWGPHRYLLVILPFITLSCIALLKEFPRSTLLKIGLTIFGIVGFFINLLGNLVWTMYGYSYGWTAESLWKIQNNLPFFAWDPYFAPYIQNIKVISTNWVSTLDPNPTILNYFKIGLNGCTYDLFIYCNYGALPIIFACLIIMSIGFLIIKTLNKNNHIIN